MSVGVRGAIKNIAALARFYWAGARFYSETGFFADLLLVSVEAFNQAVEASSTVPPPQPGCQKRGKSNPGDERDASDGCRPVNLPGLCDIQSTGAHHRSRRHGAGGQVAPAEKQPAPSTNAYGVERKQTKSPIARRRSRVAKQAISGSSHACFDESPRDRNYPIRRFVCRLAQKAVPKQNSRVLRRRTG